MNIKRAFTLIELLIVISIISMLSSIILATTTTVKAKGRDAQRIQQIRQIDLALRLYIEANGHAPYLGGTGCQTISTAPTSSVLPGCIAVSTPGVSGGYDANWSTFTGQISPYMPRTPSDPCGSSCISASGFPIGYTYVAPVAMQYYCSLSGTLCSGSVNNSSYQMYAPLEQQVPSYGSNGLTSNYFSPAGVGDVTPPSVPQNVSLVLTDQLSSTLAQSSWSASTDTGGAGIAGYKVYYSHDSSPTFAPRITSLTSDSTTILSGLYVTICVEVSAYDNIGNESAHSSPRTCQPVP